MHDRRHGRPRATHRFDGWRAAALRHPEDGRTVPALQPAADRRRPRGAGGGPGGMGAVRLRAGPAVLATAPPTSPSRPGASRSGRPRGPDERPARHRAAPAQRDAGSRPPYPLDISGRGARRRRRCAPARVPEPRLRVRWRAAGTPSHDPWSCATVAARRTARGSGHAGGLAGGAHPRRLSTTGAARTSSPSYRRQRGTAVRLTPGHPGLLGTFLRLLEPTLVAALDPVERGRRRCSPPSGWSWPAAAGRRPAAAAAAVARAVHCDLSRPRGRPGSRPGSGGIGSASEARNQLPGPGCRAE